MAIRLKVLDGCPVRLKTGADETVLLQTGEGYPIYPEPYTGEYEITPTESEIGLQTNGLMMTSDVTVHGIPTDYVGSAIDRRDSSSISVSGPDVTVPLGYYEDNASVSIANGSAAVPSLNIEKNPTISVSTGGLITATVSTSETVSPVIQAGYVDSGTSGTITFSGTATQQLTVKSSSDLSVNGPTVTAPAGFYAESASRSVSNGNIGVPYIVQDAVTNHSVKLTPFYTRTQGWISESGTYSGAAVTVSASDLVSGSDTFTANNTYDVTNLASVTVEVDYSPELQTKTNIDPTLSSQTITADEGYDGLYSVQINAMPSGTAGTPSTSKGAVNNHSITVTPSVTNVTGYITGGTINGTAVTVSASELVSGTYSVTSAGTADVTNYASVSVPSGTAGTPTATKGTVTNHSVTVTPSVTNSAGYISGGTHNGTAVSVSASELVSGTYTVSSSGTKDVTNYASISVASGSLGTELVDITKTSLDYDIDISFPQFVAGYIGTAPSVEVLLDVEDKSITPSASQQVVTPTDNLCYLNSVTVAAVPSGTEGTPTATKGTVTNHSVTVTPSVTNTAGYISGGTHNGTAVTVSASELVSGSETKTSNGTYDVTNLASLVVNVSGGGGIGDLLSTTAIGAYSTSSTQATNMNKNIAATNVNGYDVLLVETSVDTEVANRHMATVGAAFIVNSTNAATKNAAVMANAKWNAKLSSSSVTQTTSSTTSYGLYPNSCTMTTTSNGTATFAMYSRYNSSRSGTINGTYTARVYGIKLCDLIGG